MTSDSDFRLPICVLCSLLFIIAADSWSKVMRPLFALISAVSVSCFFWMSAFAEDSTARTYENRLTLLENPPPLLADYPEFVEPVRELRRFEAPILVNDEGADLSVRAWRFSYNARG